VALRGLCPATYLDSRVCCRARRSSFFGRGPLGNPRLSRLRKRSGHQYGG
jgi:hypothetical protein